MNRVNEKTTDERRLQLWHEFEAGGPPGTELLSFDQREEEPWSFVHTPLFTPTPKERERLKGHKVDLDENSVIGGHFITKEGDWKIKSVGGSAYSHGKSTQTIRSVGGGAYSRDTSTQNIGSVTGDAVSNGTSTQTIESVGRYAYRYGESTQNVGAAEPDEIALEQLNVASCELVTRARRLAADFPNPDHPPKSVLPFTELPSGIV